MRFVISEYLSSLKEDRELDSFLEELLKSMGLIPFVKIQRGRQYGVDLPAIGSDTDKIRKLFLFVIKQGNFSRKNWDSGNVNDIRPSISEILDVYLSTRIPKPYDTLPIKIVVCCNGEIETAVQENWAQFVNKHTSSILEFDFWGLSRLVDYAQKYQMQEEIMSSDLSLNFRRALSFIDLPDYNLSHLYKFINSLLPAKDSEDIGDKQIRKKIRLINLCMSIIHMWCKKSNNLKPSFIASERIVLITFNWLKSNNFGQRKMIWKDFYSLLQNWRYLNHSYLERTAEYFTIQDGLGIGIGNHDEYCLIAYEQMGMLSVMGLFELWECRIALSQNDNGAMDRADYAYKNAEGIANLIARLIENNASTLNPRYDEHCIEINMVLTLFFEVGLFKEAVIWLRNIIDRLILNVKIANFFPLFNTDPNKLRSEKASDQKSSLLSNMLAEWCLVLRQLGYYHSLKDFLKKEMPSLNLQMWIPDETTDEFLYSNDASNKSGSTMIGIKLPDNYLLLEMHIAEERVIFNCEEEFSYNKYFLLFMPFLAARHFRTYPFPNSWRGYLSTGFCFSKAPSETD